MQQSQVFKILALRGLTWDFNPSTQEVEAGRSESEASMAHLMNPRPARDYIARRCFKDHKTNIPAHFLALTREAKVLSSTFQLIRREWGQLLGQSQKVDVALDSTQP